MGRCDTPTRDVDELKCVTYNYFCLVMCGIVQGSTHNYTIGVIHHMVAMGVDELDQDLRMAHRQNYRRLSAMYPNIQIKYVFAVKQEKDGKTNVGFESQFGEWM